MKSTLSKSALALAVVFSSALAAPAADDALGEPKSPAVKAARQTYEAAVKKAQAELSMAQLAYLLSLDTALKQAMQAGDLDEANRINALRKSVAAAGVSAAPAAKVRPPAAESADARRKPGWVVGAITDSGGKPIRDVTFDVNCFGTTIKAGERASFRLEVDADGRFAQEIPDGLYAVTAYIEKDFNGSRFRIQLHPADEKSDQTKLASKQGIVKDFVWKLTGTRPGLDPKMTSAHYGTSVRVYDSQYLGEDNDKLAGKFPQDAQALVTLTPSGPLIDGSKGAPIEIKAPLATVGKTLGHVALDIPIGPYTATAKVLTPDGKSSPLTCSTAFRGPFKGSADIAFEQPSVYDSIKPVSLYLNP